MSAGVATVLSGDFRYRCTVEFSIAGGKGNGAALSTYRHALLENLLPFRSQRGSDFEATSDWTVWTHAERGTVRYTFLSSSIEGGAAELDRFIRSYHYHLRSVARAALTTRGEAEMILSQRLKQMRRQVQVLQGQGEEAGDRSTGGEPDPVRHREAATELLNTRRADYTDVRRALDEVTSRLDALRRTPIPRTVRVDPDVRRAALEADVELTQDLKTLTLHLTEVKARLGEVQDASSEPLGELTAAADALHRVGDAKAAESASGPHRLAAEKLVEAAGDYQRALTQFVGSWEREFTALRESVPDPQSAGLIETQERLSRLLGDVLFALVEPRSAMKAQVNALAAEPHNAARHHELISIATRRFHKLCSAERRFQFTASDVKTINNPRLDAAMRSARGLHGRSQARIRDIDRRLQDETYQRAVEQRRQRMADLQQEIDRLRPQADAVADLMLEAQDELTQAAPNVDAFLQRRFTADEKARRLERLRADIESTQARLKAISANRTSPVDPDAVTVVDRHVERRPVNLFERLASGWLVTATCLLLILFGQRMLGARGGEKR
ncbi:MAG: hypothetical protein JSV19_12005 [Phycisphaerales bacterium]|nr:MAG: hypothetical protein JSV19_12005 [Phycisphaerales bacterium]